VCFCFVVPIIYSLYIIINSNVFLFKSRYSPLSPADFFAAASYLPAAAAAAASATTLSPSTGK